MKAFTMSTDDLTELVAGARGGDLAAYGELVRRFQDMAFGYACSVLGDFHLAQDAAQEAFLEAFRCLGGLREPAAFPGWLRRIVFKHCDRILRRRRPAAPLTGRDAPASGDDPAAAAERQEIAGLVLQAIASLPEAQRAVTTLFYVNGYSQADIASFLEVPPATVRTRLHAARGRLRERMIHMVDETLKANTPGERFPERIAELLALPRPLEIEGHPIRRAWEAFRGAFPEFELVEPEEVLERRLSPLTDEQVAAMAHQVDQRRILRTDLDAAMVAHWLARGGGPSRLISAGRTFRKGDSPTPEKSAQAFHMAELLCVGEGLSEQSPVEMARLGWEAVLGGVDVRVSESVHVGGGIYGPVFSSPWRGEWLEWGVAGLFEERRLRAWGLDPGRFRAVCVCFGLDRCAMIRHGIEDIRRLWEPPYVRE